MAASAEAAGRAGRRRLLDRLRRPVELHVADARAAALVGCAYAAASPLLPSALHVDCLLRRWTGVPCPLCGMTTSVGSLLRLDPEAAVRANPFGIAVVALGALLIVRPPRRVAAPAWAVLALAAASWTWELGRFGWL